MAIRVAATLALLMSVTTSAALAAAPESRSRAKAPKLVPSFKLNDIGAPLLIPRESAARPVARLTEPSTAGLVAPPRYVVGREGNAATGKRAKLSVAVGDTTLFAVSGKIPTRPRAGVVDDVRSTHKLESGKLWGGGIERRFGGIEVGAEYRYSTINAQELDPTADYRAVGMDMDDKSKSHSVRATARLRF